MSCRFVWSGNNRSMRPDIDDFYRDGFTLLPAAVDAELIASCQDAVWANLESQGVRRAEPSSWSGPVVRVRCLDDALNHTAIQAQAGTP